jgi:hypothetical protein
MLLVTGKMTDIVPERPLQLTLALGAAWGQIRGTK